MHICVVRPGTSAWFNAAPAELAEAALWLSGDPETDIDGEARPTTDSTADYVGADIPN